MVKEAITPTISEKRILTQSKNLELILDLKGWRISGWLDLTKLEGGALKPRSSFKGLWTVVREAIYQYKLPVPLKQSFI